MDAGLEVFFGYPITPATTILEMLAARLPRQGGRVLQTEDEIAAISAAIGAGYAGARAATATSGPGLALMTEMLGLGVMAEVPVVIFVSQRGGPSTGMPTKTEQSDLNLAVFGGSGDAKRIVLAPTNVEGCYRCAGRAFELAEQYQTPVIVLLDLYLSNRLESVGGLGKTRFAPNLSKGLAARAPGEAYQRFALTEDWDQPPRHPGRARRHPYGDRPRAQRARPAQGHTRDPPADDREAPREAGAGDPSPRPVHLQAVRRRGRGRRRPDRLGLDLRRGARGHAAGAQRRHPLRGDEGGDALAAAGRCDQELLRRLPRGAGAGAQLPGPVRPSA